jgi:hypothetical protein
MQSHHPCRYLPVKRIPKHRYSSYKEGETLAKRVRLGRRYGTYGETRHNSRTYIVEIKDVEDSEDTK